MKRFRFSLICILIAVGIVACSKSMQDVLGPKGDSTSGIHKDIQLPAKQVTETSPLALSAEVKQLDLPIVYVGHETLDDVISGLNSLKNQDGSPALTDEQKQEIIASFQQYQGNDSIPVVCGTRRYAYTWHFVCHGLDCDEYLEYKWWAGSRQGYYLETTDYNLYYLIRLCYGGNILNWTWMEGGYQRVTAVVGLCAYGPFTPGYVRARLWVVSN